MASRYRMNRGSWRVDDLDDLEDFNDLDSALDIDFDDDPLPATGAGRRPRRGGKPKKRERSRTAVIDALDDDFDDVAEALERKERERRRATISEPFKCRNCRAFIGMPPSGGQQRNHCPMCLYSLHVDDRTPGDRASDCRSLMAPIGTFYRRNMEQVVVHECRGCGFVRYNRVAADDNPVLLAELPIIDPPTRAESSDEG